MSISIDASYIGPVEGEVEAVGSSVAVNADGTVFAFGDLFFDTSIGSSKGKIFVGHVSGWEFITDASYVGDSSNAQIGYDIDINGTGDKVVFSSLTTHTGYAGTVSGNDIIIDASLTTPSGNFGESVAINNTGDAFFFSSNSGAGRIYIASVSGGEFVLNESYIGGFNDNVGDAFAISSAGDKVAFTSSKRDTIYVGSVSSETITVDATFTGRLISTDGKIQISDTGEIVAYCQPGILEVYSVSGSNMVLEASISEENSGDNFGTSLGMNADGTKIIISAPSFGSDKGKVYFLSVSGSQINIDASFIGVDLLGGQNVRDGQEVAVSSDGGTFIFGEPAFNSGKVYIASFPDADGDGIIDLEDVFTNQQLNVVPTAIPGLTNVFAIAPGKHHTLAITRDGRVLSFGRNQSGQLGRLTTDVSGHVPADVSGASNGYAAIEAAARLPAGDAYVREDVYGSTAQKRAVKIMLSALVSQLDGTEGFNTELARHYLSKL